MNPKRLLVAGLVFGLFFFYFAWLHTHVFTFSAFQKYPALARQYLQGTLSPERWLDVSPTYFYLHVFMARITSHPDYWIKWLQIFLLAGSSGLFFLTLRRWFPLSISLLAVFVLMLDTHVLVYSGILEPEPLLLFFLLTFIFFAQGISHLSRVLAGLAFALMILTRPNLLPLVLLMPVHFWLQEKKWRKCLASFMFFFVPVLLALPLLWLRNYSLEGRFSPLVMNPGTVFYEGNNPCSRGKSSVYPLLVDEMISEYKHVPDYQHAMYREFARRITGRSLSVAEVNSYWFGKAWCFIRDNPGHFLLNLVNKAGAVFNNHNRHDILAAWLSDRKLARSWLPRIPFAVIAALALLGLFLGIPEWRRFFLIYVLFFAQFLVMIFTYVSARQRLALAPLLVIFAALVFGELRQHRRWLLLSLPFLVFLGLNFLTSDWFVEEDHVWRCQLESAALKARAEESRTRGHLEEAAGLNSMALAQSPWLHEWLRLADLPLAGGRWLNEALYLQQKNASPGFSGRFDHAFLLWLNGKYSAAAAIFQQLRDEGHQFSRDFEQSSQPLYYLARMQMASGRAAAALESLKEGLRQSPGDPYLLAQLFVLSGDFYYRDALFSYYDNLDAQFFVGQAYLQNGQPDRALPCLRYVSRLLPEFRRGLIYHAVALARCGQTSEAVTAYLSALNRRRDPVFFEQDVLDLFNQWQKIAPPQDRAGYYQGIVLRQYGLLREARDVLARERKIFPQDERLANQLNWLTGAIKD